MDRASTFFLKHVHGLELSGELQEAVLEYRRNRQKLTKEDTEGHSALFEKYHEFLTDIYKEDLEHWINENRVLDINLKKR